MFKIYYKDKIIQLILKKDKNSFLSNQSNVFINKNEFLSFYSLFDLYKFEVKNSNLFIVIDNFNSFLKKIKKEFEIITAAGGVVMNEENDILFIIRNDTWDLPKGKVEKGEKLKDAAIREVKEECGLTDLKILKKITTSYHIYFDNKPIFKKTHWYLMKGPKIQLLKAQHEEGISYVGWQSLAELAHIKKNTFPNICDVIQSTFDNDKI